MIGHRLALLTETSPRVLGSGAVIGNVSVQLIGTLPRIGSRRQEAERALSTACHRITLRMNPADAPSARKVANSLMCSLVLA